MLGICLTVGLVIAGQAQTQEKDGTTRLEKLEERARKKGDFSVDTTAGPPAPRRPESLAESTLVPFSPPGRRCP